jgi:hypothetical protein
MGNSNVNSREWTHVLLVNTPCSHLHSFCATGVSSGLVTRVTLIWVSRVGLGSLLHRMELQLILFLCPSSATWFLLGCILNVHSSSKFLEGYRPTQYLIFFGGDTPLSLDHLCLASLSLKEVPWWHSSIPESIQAPPGLPRHNYSPSHIFISLSIHQIEKCF